MSVVDDALALAARNIPVFPCASNKAPARSKDDGGNGFRDATCDPTEVRRLWRHWRGPLIGMPCGAVSGLFVVDVDAPRHPEAEAWLERHAPYLGETYQCTTRSGGTHIFFRHHPELKTTAGRLCRGVDTRGDGGYVILWAREVPAPVQETPQWLVAALRPPKPPQVIQIIPRCRRNGSADDRVHGVLRRVGAAREGERNALTYWGACRITDMIESGELSCEDGNNAFEALATVSRYTGLPERAIDATIKSAMKRSQ
ncbi:bifunctional DNA primase/polymerase [Bradyrhizobium sp. SZCCHNRI3043]|uniref:bifunctional DNA primase/polymerase n=1 Tax=Bradyrhizobium sp. SZCCHNRI3043 TaxID=3057292 RepID=UPI0028E5EDF2|nr:bifunctional DNA primase/polymerase [Bradyrhizobium sp. SZCCHNRI3043]